MGAALLGDGWANSASGVSAPGPVASCCARSLASCTNCSLAATGALSQRKSIIAPTCPSGARYTAMRPDVVARPARFSIILAPALRKQLDRLVGVAAGVLQGLLAVHHGQAGPFAERLTAAAVISAIGNSSGCANVIRIAGDSSRPTGVSPHHRRVAAATLTVVF